MFWWLAQHTLTTILLAGLVALLCRLRALSPAVRHALWLVVLLKLLTPPVLVWPWAMPAWLPAPVAEAGALAEPQAGGLELSVDELPLAELQEVPGAETRADRASSVASSSNGQAGAGMVFRPAWLLVGTLGLWLAGAAVMAGLQGLRLLRLYRLLRTGRDAPRWLTAEVRGLARRLGVWPPRAFVLPRLGTPCVWGAWRTRLLWPQTQLEGLAAECRQTVIAHELAHLRRRDHWIGWLLLVGECVWWWNPLFWYVRRQLRLYAELACDAWVVWTLPEGRRAYAEALLEVTQWVSQTAAPVPAAGMGGARACLERRLVMVMRESVPCRVSLAGFLVVGMLALVALPGWSQADDQPAKPQPPAKGEPQSKDKVFIFTEVKPVEIHARTQEVPQAKTFTIHVDEPKIHGVDLPAGEGDRNRRLREVEEQIQKLLEEVRALRDGGTPKQIRLQVTTPKTSDSKTTQQPAAPRQQFLYFTPSTAQPTYSVTTVKEGEQTMTLSRVKYRLSHAKAEALGSFLNENVKAEVLETKVDGDTLIVTTTPEVQNTIGALANLVAGKAQTFTFHLRQAQPTEKPLQIQIETKPHQSKAPPRTDKPE
jgi:beta-lactamase regulating signal transducer with metallopeptidase domain